MEKSELLESVSSGTHIVKFYATWCGPCKVVDSMLKNITESRDDLNVISINVEDHVELRKEFEVRSIPTLLFFKDGEVYEKSIGSINAQEIIEKLEKGA